MLEDSDSNDPLKMKQELYRVMAMKGLTLAKKHAYSWEVDRHFYIRLVNICTLGHNDFAFFLEN